MFPVPIPFVPAMHDCTRVVVIVLLLGAPAARNAHAPVQDTATWHTAFPCTGHNPRRTAIYGWSVRTRHNGSAGTPTEAARELDQSRLLKRPSLRRVLGFSN